MVVRAASLPLIKQVSMKRVLEQSLICSSMRLRCKRDTVATAELKEEVKQEQAEEERGQAQERPIKLKNLSNRF
jgi:hypothetical protein